MALGLRASPPVVLLLLSLLGLAAAGKLLVVWVDGSPWFTMREGLDLLQQKGHEVVVVVPEVTLHVKPLKNFVMKVYPVPFTKEEMDKAFQAFFHITFEEGPFLERYFKVFEAVKRFTDFAFSSCRHLLQNKELISYLEESKFDAILTDPAIPCGVILAEHLSLPSVYFLRGIPCGFDFEATQCPNPPSYVPQGFSQFTDHMTFSQRVKNLLFEIPNVFLCDFAFQPYSKLASEFLQRELIPAGMALGLRASPPVVLLLLSLLGLAAAGKLLVVWVDGSPWFTMREGLDLLQQKGHEVVVVVPEVTLHVKPLKNFVMKVYPVPFTKEEMDKAFQAFFHITFEEGPFLERYFKVFEAVKRFTDFAFSSCRHLLQNKELISYLEESKFDAILTDPAIPCGVILAEHLSLPSVYFLRGIPCGFDFEATQCPNPPSYVPQGFSQFTDHMTFSQRVKNLLFEIPNVFLCDFAFQPYSKLASEFLQRE
ncbi:hypothetical protein DV515_00019526, partial [Chloebia gouldiae]